METEPGKPALIGDDAEHEKRVRKFAFIGLIFVVVVLISTILVAGTENLALTAWLLLLAGMGIFQAIQLLRHPELIRRPQPGPTLDEIIARGGIDPQAEGQSVSSGETRLAILNLLDQIEMLRSFRGSGIPTVVLGGLGTLGWIAGAVASVVLGPDLASAALCLVAAAGFGVLTVISTRYTKRVRMAERILEGQLISLDGGTIETPGPSRFPSGREGSREWT